ncbi:hypothetical protein ABK905_05915 [Acerihabitans sp. KWT182]|uniref:Uncharacterized protein n=1 Tax=Acerihabitans sp. KWT182 TaxID=3157919 RepID=A0AAU7QCN4_9GAMM
MFIIILRKINQELKEILDAIVIKKEDQLYSFHNEKWLVNPVVFNLSLEMTPARKRFHHLFIHGLHFGNIRFLHELEDIYNDYCKKGGC